MQPLRVKKKNQKPFETNLFVVSLRRRKTLFLSLTLKQFGTRLLAASEPAAMTPHGDVGDR